MRRIALAAGVPLGLLLVAPTAALAADGPTLDDTISAVNTTWVIVAGVLVMFMQAGFLFLEVAFRARRTRLSGRQDPDQLLDLRLRTGLLVSPSHSVAPGRSLATAGLRVAVGLGALAPLHFRRRDARRPVGQLRQVELHHRQRLGLVVADARRRTSRGPRCTPRSAPASRSGRAASPCAPSARGSS